MRHKGWADGRDHPFRSTPIFVPGSVLPSRKMNLPLLFARRYLFAKRSTNAINIITAISITVIAVVTAAMVVVLSTLNGISELVDTIYSPFDQDLTITPAEGKTFDRKTLDLRRCDPCPRYATRVG